MPQHPVDEQSIKDYLLGDSSEAEIERFDEMSLTDDEFVERLRAIENDLVDAYVQGGLSGRALARFNSHYLASPRRREKVRFAETLAGFPDKSGIAQPEEMRVTLPAISLPTKAAGRERSGTSLFGLPRLALQWGFAAAALLLLLTAGYLTVENLRLRDEVVHAQWERAGLEQREQELQQQLATQRASDAETEKELASVRDRLAQLEKQLAPGQPRDLKVIAFNLSPPTRGIGRIPTFAVPGRTDQVALTLELEANDFPAYRAALKNPGTGQILWRSGKLKGSANTKAVRISVPARILKTQNYVLELSGISTSGQGETVSSYPFRVEIQ